MSNSTHRTRLARSLQTATGLSYRTALARVDLAATARLLPTPLDPAGMDAALQTLLKLTPPSTHPGLAPTQSITSSTNLAHPFSLSVDELAHPTLVFGADHEAKRTAMRSLTSTLLQRHGPGLVVDPAGDRFWRDWCPSAAASANTAFQQVSLGGPAPSFEPFHGLNAEQAARVITSLLEFDDQYWENLNAKLAGQLTQLMFQAYELNPQQFDPPSLLEAAHLLSAMSLVEATAFRRRVVAERSPVPQVFESLASPTADEARAARGMGARLARMYGPTWADSPPPVSAQPDLFAPGLSYAGLGIHQQPEVASMVAAVLLQRFIDTTGQDGSPRFVVVDEADMLSRRTVLSLVEYAARTNIPLVLGFRGPSCWYPPEFTRLSQSAHAVVSTGLSTAEDANLAAALLTSDTGLEPVLARELRQLADGQLYVRPTRTAAPFEVNANDLRVE